MQHIIITIKFKEDMCLRKYIEKVTKEYMDSHPHPIEDHTHENYVDKSQLGYVFFGNNSEVEWKTSVSGVSTSVYLDVKTIL